MLTYFNILAFEMCSVGNYNSSQASLTSADALGRLRRLPIENRDAQDPANTEAAHSDQRRHIRRSLAHSPPPFAPTGVCSVGGTGKNPGAYALLGCGRPAVCALYGAPCSWPAYESRRFPGNSAAAYSPPIPCFCCCGCSFRVCCCCPC
ncbi:hypothetical protein B0H10DRAFT_915048 [Mycena sp. CBHHK59/15]|nr:hypothetical protein B0H10DRAFT_915048 [Mycena sp. CBHHK59/15]